MRTVKLLALLFLLVASFASAAERSPAFVTDFTFRTGWGIYRLHFTDIDFEGSPVWKPGGSEPPLLPGDAHKRVIEALKGLRPNDWQLYSTVSISLTRTNEDPLGRFYYSVHLYRLPESDKLAPMPLDPKEERMLFYYVLLDGKVLEPKLIKMER